MSGWFQQMRQVLQTIGCRGALAVCGALALVAGCSETSPTPLAPSSLPSDKVQVLSLACAADVSRQSLQWWAGAGAIRRTETSGRARSGYDHVHAGVGLIVSARDESGQMHRPGRASTDRALLPHGEGGPDPWNQQYRGVRRQPDRRCHLLGGPDDRTASVLSQWFAA